MWVGDISPAALARHDVRCIFASTPRSSKQLNANAAPANSQMPKLAQSTVRHGGSVGVAKNMPMMAQNTAN
jgi:hypothetical protein